jgi:hypothetical protein
MIQQSDVPRVAATVRVAGELFEVHGALMLQLTHDWSAGAKAANLDPDSGGNRWEPCGDPTCQECPHAVPSDPTGEAVLALRRGDLAVELQGRLERVVADCQWLRDMAHVLAPIVPPSTMNDKDDRWCSNCLRAGLANPRWRATECRNCYEFRLAWKVPQPLSLVKCRHMRGKVTPKMEREALEADGLILQTVGGVTKAVRQARGSTGRSNQNRKKAG